MNRQGLISHRDQEARGHQSSQGSYKRATLHPKKGRKQGGKDSSRSQPEENLHKDVGKMEETHCQDNASR